MPPARGRPVASASSGVRYPKVGGSARITPVGGWWPWSRPDADNREVMGWLLQAATLLCAVPATGRWTAAVHAGVPSAR